MAFAFEKGEILNLLNNYVARAVFNATVLVLLVVVALDSIASLVDELADLRGDYTIGEALFYVFLNLPSSVYEFLPLAALVGCLIGLGMLAGTSELVVMRAAGVSVSQLIWAVFRPVTAFIFLGAFISEFIAPYADQYADSRRALALGHKKALQSERGVWNREANEFMHFNVVLPNGKLYGVTRFLFDEVGDLVYARFTDSAIYQGDHWFEQNIQITHFGSGGIHTERVANGRWRSEVSPVLLNMLVLSPEELPMRRLNEHVSYLKRQNLDATEYQLAFWQKALQPLATLSLMVIAISFILGPLRQVTMGFRVFIGVIVGLVFQTSQQLLGPASIIWGFSPMIAVLLPIVASVVIGFILLRRAQ